MTDENHSSRLDDSRIGDSRCDDIVDEILPYDLDWRHLVRSYPIPALAAVAVGGFVLGRQHGWPLVNAMMDQVSREVQRNVRSVLDGVMGGDDADEEDLIDADD